MAIYLLERNKAIDLDKTYYEISIESCMQIVITLVRCIDVSLTQNFKSFVDCIAVIYSTRIQYPLNSVKLSFCYTANGITDVSLLDCDSNIILIIAAASNMWQQCAFSI